MTTVDLQDELLAAVNSDDVKAIDSLLQAHGENAFTMLTLKTAKGYTLFHRAVLQNSLSVLDFLLEYCIKFKKSVDFLISCRNNWNETPIHLACAMGNLRAAQLILLPRSKDSSVRSDYLDNWGRTPWAVAVDNGYEKDLRSILEPPYCIFSEIKSIPDSTCKSIPERPRGVLLENFSELSLSKMKKTNSSSSRSDKVEVLVKTIFGSYVEHIDRWTSFDPAERDSKQLILPSNTAQSESSSKRNGHAEAGSIAKVRSSISKHLEYPGDLEALQRMVANSSDFDPNGKDMFGLSALHKLSSWDKPDLLAALFGSGEVDPFSVSPDGFTCLHCAVDMRAQSSLQWLLNNLSREDLRTLRDMRDKKGRTALLLAQEHQKLNQKDVPYQCDVFVRLLIEEDQKDSSQNHS